MWHMLTFFLFSAKVSKVLAYVSIVLVLTAAFVALIMAALVPITVSMPPDALAFATAVIPANFDVCISVVISARIARLVYDRNMKIADKASD